MICCAFETKVAHEPTVATSWDKYGRINDVLWSRWIDDALIPHQTELLLQ